MSKVALGLIFLCIFLVVYRIGMSMTADEKKKKRRILSITEADDSFIDLQEGYDQEQSAKAKFLELIVRPVRNVPKVKEPLQRKLYQGGYNSPDAISYYLFFSTFGWIFGLLIALLLFKLGFKQEGAVSYIYYFLGLMFGLGLTFCAPLTVKNAKDKRMKVLMRSFPDALDLLLICVESGLALDAALARVCRELKYVHPEITEELNRTRLELTLLNDRAKALQNLAERTDMMAFKSLVAALLQSEKFGTSLVETLRVLSDDYRQTRMMLAEEKAAKLDPKITAVTIPFMLAALLILIMTPAVLKFGQKYTTVSTKPANAK